MSANRISFTIRMVSSAWILYHVYKTASPFVFLSLIFVFVAIEVIAYSLDDMLRRIRELERGE